MISVSISTKTTTPFLCSCSWTSVAAISLASISSFSFSLALSHSLYVASDETTKIIKWNNNHKSTSTRITISATALTRIVSPSKAASSILLFSESRPWSFFLMVSILWIQLSSKTESFIDKIERLAFFADCSNLHGRARALFWIFSKATHQLHASYQLNGIQ